MSEQVLRVQWLLKVFDRWLVNNGRDDEALAVLSRTRGLPPDCEAIQIEFLYV